MTGPQWLGISPRTGAFGQTHLAASGFMRERYGLPAAVTLTGGGERDEAADVIDVAELLVEELKRGNDDDLDEKPKDT